MGYWAMNTKGNINTIRYEIFHEHIQNGLVAPHVAGTFPVGGFTAPGQWMYWWLVADSDSSPARVVTTHGESAPAEPFKRMMGAWGTEPGKIDPVMQQQVNRIVQFRGDYDFDQNIASAITTNGNYMVRGNHGGWPPHKCCALYFRGEAGRADKTSVCQINFAGWADDGTDQAWFVTQAKGLGQQGEYASVSHDGVRVALDPQIDSFAVMVNSNNRGLALLSGYELTPN